MRVFLYILVFGVLCLCISTKKVAPVVKKEAVPPVKGVHKNIDNHICFYRNEYRDSNIFFYLRKRGWKTFFIDDSFLFPLSSETCNGCPFLITTGHPP